jgi:hypothetical protein
MVKLIKKGDSRAAIVYSRDRGRIFLIREEERSVIPNSWWYLTEARFNLVSPSEFKKIRESGEGCDDSIPYRAKKDVICEIHMVDDICENKVGKDVFKRLRGGK